MLAKLTLASALAGLTVVLFACSGGGASQEDECEDFLQLTQECYARAGRTVATNSAACGDPNAVSPQQRGQISCSLQYRDTYCKIIAASASRDTSGIDPRDPDVVKLNACTVASTLTGACREAVLAMADCGVAYSFGTCEGASLALATCVVAHKAGACATHSPNRTSTVTPEQEAFQKCQVDAQRAAIDAGGR